MTESSFGGDDLAAGSTVEGEDNVDSAAADREAASPSDDAAVDQDALDKTRSDTSIDADVAAGYDEERGSA